MQISNSSHWCFMTNPLKNFIIHRYLFKKILVHFSGIYNGKTFCFKAKYTGRFNGVVLAKQVLTKCRTMIMCFFLAGKGHRVFAHHLGIQPLSSCSFVLFHDYSFGRCARPTNPNLHINVRRRGKQIGHIPLSSRECLVFGSKPSQCDVQLNHASISSQQAAICVHMDGGVLLIDLNSSNGSFVNGEKIEAHAGWRLENESRIWFGDSELEFELRTDVWVIFFQFPYHF